MLKQYKYKYQTKKLLKNTFDISKLSYSNCLLNVLQLKSIDQLYNEYKLLFIKLLRRNNFTKQIYDKNYKGIIYE